MRCQTKIAQFYESFHWFKITKANDITDKKFHPPIGF